MSLQELVDGVNRLLQIESRSYIQYLRDAEFLAYWDNTRFEDVDADIQSTVERVVREETGHVDQILDLLASIGGTPDFSTAYALEEGFYNYLRADYFLRILIERLGDTAERFSGALVGLESYEPVAGPMKALLEAKRNHIAELEALLESRQAATAPAE